MRVTLTTQREPKIFWDFKLIDDLLLPKLITSTSSLEVGRWEDDTMVRST